MPDRMSIIGKDGRVRYIIDDDTVIDLVNHTCVYEDELAPCVICNQYPDELKEI